MYNSGSSRLERIDKLCRAASTALDGYLRFRSSQFRTYQNTEHIMTEDNEILIPSTEESYMFDKNVWNIDYINEYIVLTKKRSRREE